MAKNLINPLALINTKCLQSRFRSQVTEDNSLSSKWWNQILESQLRNGNKKTTQIQVFTFVEK